MQPLNGLKGRVYLSLYLKCGAILLLFALSVLVVACSSSPPTDSSLGNPTVTVTINLNQIVSSPTPPLPAYTCGAWVTNTTPGYNTTSVVEVYAKFVHNGADDNPVGMGNANAVATVMWPDGGTNTIDATTTSDGLAIFPVTISGQAEAINKVVLVTVVFTSSDGQHTCTVGQDQAAYFTLVIASPTATKGPSPTATGTPGGPVTPTGTPRPKKTPVSTPGG